MNALAKITSVLLLSTSFASSSNDYFPHNDNDISRFKNNYEQKTDIQVTALYGSNWKQYSNYLGQQDQWIWTSDNSQQVYWLNNNGDVDLLIDFDDPIGTEYSVDIDGCTDYAKLQNKQTPLNTALAHFERVLQIEFTGHCRDGGLLSASFVEGVGLVQWQTQSIAGPVSHDLYNASIQGVDYPKLHGLQVSTQMDSGLFDLNKKTHAAAFILIQNNNESDINLTFNSGQKFEIEILDEQSNIVNRWSNNRLFTEAIQTVSIAPNTSMKFGDFMPLTNINGSPLHFGNYRLRIKLKGRDDNWQSNNDSNTYQIETPFSVTYEY